MNAIEYPESEDEQTILVCVIDLVMEDQEMDHLSLITSDELMIISPNTTISESWNDRRNNAKNRRRNRKLGLSEFSKPKWQNIKIESSLSTIKYNQSQSSNKYKYS